MLTSMKTRMRVVGILASVVLPVLSGCADAPAEDEETLGSTASALVTDATLYADGAVATGWASWSWSSVVAFANADVPLASGSASQIKTTTGSSGGALSLAHAAADLSIADYDSIVFDVRGPSAASIRLHVQTLAGTTSGADVTVPVTTTWTRQTVKLASLQGSLTQLGKVNWSATVGGQTFYVDNVRLVAKASSFPLAPMAVKKADVVTLSSGKSDYSVYVPNSYDATHQTPTRLLVWLHGCGGNAYGDTWATSPGGAQSWISMSVGGRDGGCWNMETDVPTVLAALDDLKRRVNVDPRRVFIGGYSSGGNLAYRTAFYNAKRFAGILAENTGAFYGTDSSQTASIAASAWKLNVAHLAHLSDTTYPISITRSETDALKNAGFPTTRIERAGTHWDPDTSSSGTNYDMRKDLLRYLDGAWVAPL